MKILNIKSISKKNNKSMLAGKQGFSLVELIIAMFISSLIIITVVAAFASAFKAQKNARNTQRDIEGAKASLEAMAKIIRMGSNPVTKNANKTVYMYNSSLGQCIQYDFSNGSFIQEQHCTSCNSNNPCANADFTTNSDLTTCNNSNPGTIKGDCLTGSLSTPVQITPTLKNVLFQIPTYAGILNPIKRVTVVMQMFNDQNAYLETTVSLRDYHNLNPTSQ